MKPAGLLALFLGLAGISAAQQPTIRQQQGVENSASYSTMNPPGSLVAIFGSNFAAENLIASSTPLSMQIQSKTETVSVTINGVPAPMYYALPAQASVQVPWETISGTGSIVVTRNGVKSSPYNFSVATFSPGVFTVSQDGKGMAWVINNNDGSVAQPAGSVAGVTLKPAKAGDNLYFYMTGLGPVSPPMANGAAPCPVTGACPGYIGRNTTTKPTILVGGVAIPADHLQFSGLSPRYVGVYQVNFQLPSGIPASNTTKLQVEIGGVTSNSVNFATQ